MPVGGEEEAELGSPGPGLFIFLSLHCPPPHRPRSEGRGAYVWERGKTQMGRPRLQRHRGLAGHPTSSPPRTSPHYGLFETRGLSPSWGEITRVQKRASRRGRTKAEGPGEPREGPEEAECSVGGEQGAARGGQGSSWLLLGQVGLLGPGPGQALEGQGSPGAAGSMALGADAGPSEVGCRSPCSLLVCGSHRLSRDELRCQYRGKGRQEEGREPLPPRPGGWGGAV